VPSSRILSREARSDDSISFDEIVTQNFVIICEKQRSGSDQTAVVVPNCHQGHILIDTLMLYLRSVKEAHVERASRASTRVVSSRLLNIFRLNLVLRIRGGGHAVVLFVDALY
jgi:hypothetical protein